MVRINKIICLILMLIAFVSFAACSDKKNGVEKLENAEDIEIEEESLASIEFEEEKGIDFPYELDDGNLVVNALFQSSIENPDCGNEYADDIASLEIVNQSGRFLESAVITLTMSDGAQMHMTMRDIPADQKVWVFENNNVSLTGEMVCVTMDCETNYLGQVPEVSHQIAVDVEGTTITIANQSEEIVSGVTVECHCLFDDVYYGGQTYNYPIDEISPGGAVVVEAEDCYLGTAEVVLITE